MLAVGVVVFAGLLAAVCAWLLLGSHRSADATAPAVSGVTVEKAIGRSARLRALLRAQLDPARTTEVALTAALVVLIGTALGVGALLIMIRTRSGLAWWDSAAANWGASHATATSTSILKVVTQLGGTVVVIVVALAVATAETIRTRRSTAFGFLIAVFVGITVIVNATKWLVDRTRPNVDRLVGFSGPSFPSGHAATAAALYAAFALLVGRGHGYGFRRALGAGAAGIAVAVAATRVLLGVHWVTDVAAGLLIGWAWFALCSIAFGGQRLRFGAPVALAERKITEPPQQRSSAGQAGMPSA